MIFLKQARCKEKQLKGVANIPFPNGLPSYGTIKKKLTITSLDKGHDGRIERRKYTLDTNIDWFENKKNQKNLEACVTRESTVISKGREKTEKRYFITNLKNIKKLLRNKIPLG